MFWKVSSWAKVVDWLIQTALLSPRVKMLTFTWLAFMQSELNKIRANFLFFIWFLIRFKTDASLCRIHTKRKTIMSPQRMNNTWQKNKTSENQCSDKTTIMFTWGEINRDSSVSWTWEPFDLLVVGKLTSFVSNTSHHTICWQTWMWDSALKWFYS